MITNSKVLESRPIKDGKYIKRRRELRNGDRITTIELDYEEFRKLAALLELFDVFKERVQSTTDQVDTQETKNLKELGYLV